MARLPEVAMLLASIARRAGQTELAKGLQEFASESTPRYSRAAHQELSLLDPSGAVPRLPSLISERIESPPVVDGILDDSCWQVTGSAVVSTKSAMPTVQICHDDRNLYVGVKIPMTERDSSRESLVVSIDIDRDFATFLEYSDDSAQLVTQTNVIRLDETKRVSRASQTASEWACEMAIPFAELCPHGLNRSENPWRIHVARRLPTSGFSLSSDASMRVSGEAFKILKFGSHGRDQNPAQRAN